MKKIFINIFLILSLIIISCNNHKQTSIELNNEINNVNTYNDPSLNKTLASDYLFNNLENSENPYILTVSFREHNAIFSYREKNRKNYDIFSTTYSLNGDTVFLNKWDILSTRFLEGYQIPTQFLLLPGNDLKVLKVNGKNKSKTEVTIEEDGSVIMSKIVICKISDVFKASNYDSVIYYTKTFQFKKDDFVYESPCSDMDSYYFGISYARDQLGGGLLADCDYLYNIAITQSENVNHFCFCKGVSKWLSDNNRSY